MDVTGVLAAVAAATGLIAIVANLVMQSRQQSWQEKQEASRRAREADQESERQAWQEKQVVGFRWDEYKRTLYADLLSRTSSLSDITRKIGRNRETLDSNLVNIEDLMVEHYWEVDGDTLKSLDSEELKLYWDERREQHKASIREEQSKLSETLSDLKQKINDSLAELDLLASDEIRGVARELAEASERTYYGREKKQTRSPEDMRADFISLVRDDLRI